VLLAHIVEQASGQPYAAFLRQRIFHPLDMASAGAGNQAPRPEQQALGYAGEELTPSFDLETVGRGAGDIWATTGDLARWDAALTTPGPLSAASLDAMFAPQATVPDGFARLADLRYGYGWFLGEAEGHRLRFHDGGNDGFSSFNLQMPDANAIIILLSNQEANLQEISFHLAHELLSGS
jgi:CubicO group peptidase (beta-lactamase class C family)